MKKIFVWALCAMVWFGGVFGSGFGGGFGGGFGNIFGVSDAMNHGFGIASGVFGETAFAVASGSVVINEIAWAGGLDNSNDEWIELYNPGSQSVSLDGWYIEDDYTDQYVIVSGTIPAHGYFLIEDTEATSNVTADAIIGLSLANSGDTLILKDSAGTVIDTVNASGGAWYAGDNTSKATMERIDPSIIVDSASNFATASSGNGSTGSLGSSILGTPKSQNTAYQGSASQTQVEFDLSNESPFENSNLDTTVIVNNAVDLFSYGFDIVYDPAKIEYVGIREDGFLNENRATTTAFNASLENGQPGKLIVGNARVGKSTGVSGSGNLFTITFKIKAESGTDVNLNFGGGSFVADSLGDALCGYTNAVFKIASNTIGAVSGLTATQGTENYSIALSWVAPADGADTYLIFRKNQSGDFVQIGTSQTVNFTDSNSVIPGVIYEYQVKAVKNGIASTAVTITASDSRGIKGDNNRSSRVDGKDLDNLARHFGALIGEEKYDALLDTNFDGIIDGSDLIDIGANFGIKI